MPAATPPARDPEAEAAAERQRVEAERTKREEEARAAAEREAFASRLRGRAAFLSSAGEAGYRLGGV
jgi:hypothetical protein